MKIQDFDKIISIGILLMLSHGIVYAAEGDLDPNFDGDGKVITDFGGGGVFFGVFAASGLAIQTDGKIVAVGGSRTGDFAVARYNPDGSLDTSFDVDGKVTTNNTGIDFALDVVIQADGKIVAAGRSGTGLGTIVRYMTDGTLDQTFDGDGIVTDAFFSDLTGIDLQSDGKLVIAGRSGQDFALARYNTDGSLDTTFSFDGRLTTDFNGLSDIANAISIQSDGKIIAAGFAFRATGSVFDIALTRYDSNGVLDSTFDSDGRVTTPVSGSSEAHKVAIHSDGKIVVAGRTSFGSDFVVVRYHSDGSLDTSFDSDGKLTTDLGGSEEANGLVVVPNGKIVIAGFTTSTNDFALVRYNADGSLDTTFNTDGIVTTDFNGNGDSANAVILQPDGKIIASGSTDDTSQNFALARYEGDPPPPSLFSDDYENGILASDWTYVKPNWSESGGNLIGTPTAKKAEVIATPAFAGCSVCNMEASMQTAGGEGNKLWFLTWFLDKKNTVEVLMKEENDKWILRQRVNGSVVAKTKGIATILPNTFYNVQVNFDGVNFTLIVDGVTLATLPAFASPNGTVGFRVKNTTGQFGFVTIN